jgi:hypothetical protein
MREGSHRDRRKAWCRKILSLARRRGDKRPNTSILLEAERRSDAIRRAGRDAFRDPENGEVVVPVGKFYDLGKKDLNLHPGVVLHRGLAHIDPALTCF